MFDRPPTTLQQLPNLASFKTVMPTQEVWTWSGTWTYPSYLLWIGPALCIYMTNANSDENLHMSCHWPQSRGNIVPAETLWFPSKNRQPRQKVSKSSNKSAAIKPMPVWWRFGVFHVWPLGSKFSGTWISFTAHAVLLKVVDSCAFCPPAAGAS